LFALVCFDMRTELLETGHDVFITAIDAIDVP
jgi:hypothetical protein